MSTVANWLNPDFIGQVKWINIDRLLDHARWYENYRKLIQDGQKKDWEVIDLTLILNFLFNSAENGNNTYIMTCIDCFSSEYRIGYFFPGIFEK